MTFNAGEYGGLLYINMGRDVRTSTDAAITMEPRRGSVIETASNITIGTADIEVDGVKLVEGHYLVYTIQDGDVDTHGEWRVRGSVVLSGALIKSDFVKFTVLP